MAQVFRQSIPSTTVPPRRAKGSRRRVLQARRQLFFGDAVPLFGCCTIVSLADPGLGMPAFPVACSRLLELRHPVDAIQRRPLCPLLLPSVLSAGAV